VSKEVTALLWFMETGGFTFLYLFIPGIRALKAQEFLHRELGIASENPTKNNN